MDWYSKQLTQVEKELNTNFDTGLTSQQARERLERDGLNKLNEKPPKTFLQRFLAQMKDVMVIILLVAAGISLALSFYNMSIGQEADWIEPIVIVLIVLINGILGVVQESKAEAALEALKNMSAPFAKAVRDGSVASVPSAELVTGDIVEIEAGDLVPADCRVISSSSLKCDESALTGESVPVDKQPAAEIRQDAPLGDRINMVYSGCAVSYGRARAVVVSTGMGTEMGNIAAMLEGEEQGDTPLQQKLAQLGKYLGFLALGICVVIFAIGLIDKLPIMDMFMTAVSLAVAAIPEGLPAIVTIVLAIGVQRMVAKNAVIRRLPAVETLGSASVICSDKTGTLTQNRMTLVKAYAGGDMVDLDGEIPEKILDLIKMGTLCTDGSVTVTDGREKHIGDPTETSIIAAALKNGMAKEELAKEYPRLADIPFDSDRKMMTTINRIGGKNIVIVKGAPDIVMDRCVKGDLANAAAVNEQMGREALRVLAIAYKEIKEVPAEPTSQEMENDLIFGGLVGMIDPPRPEVIDSIAECKQAGIRTVMITGDHVATASAIAKQLGIMEDDSQALTGAQLAAMSDEELFENIRHYCVYARVTPTDKIRIVKAWQKAGEIVSMTGDGVNDAPALKAADIGCAMGITGTDVAKGAADMTLTDDNFATIVTAVKEGRGIYDNIRKAVQFLLSCNLGEIVTVFLSMLLWKESPLMPIQLLWVNLVTDSLPALALGMEPVEKDVMKRVPRRKDESIFAHGVGLMAILQGLMIGFLTLGAYFIGSRLFPMEGGTVNIPLGESMAFATLAISQLVHAFNIRSKFSMFKAGFLTNKYMVGAFFASLALMLIVLLVPFMQGIFEVIAMSMGQWLIILGLSLAPFIIMEVVKLFTGREGN
ncbi:calcium-translocating P-type ATPase, PMCA-type [Youxingia wuxianensis]|uniref:P-type Ca(2+) transporter n=1 Tax=Youxingia wuxianensis TaxID=2763678 RepID=A0A926EP74_9FIRM|nr:calcium-translocating P-type ATPase, PMCA-type [Youxingia wuxianensis]MBC8584029.1 calcium-translocating P-type ATPase, PMCA-type [Youxingia wuxianensis]